MKTPIPLRHAYVLMVLVAFSLVSSHGEAATITSSVGVIDSIPLNVASAAAAAASDSISPVPVAVAVAAPTPIPAPTPAAKPANPTQAEAIQTLQAINQDKSVAYAPSVGSDGESVSTAIPISMPMPMPSPSYPSEPKSDPSYPPYPSYPSSSGDGCSKWDGLTPSPCEEDVVPDRCEDAQDRIVVLQGQYLAAVLGLSNHAGVTVEQANELFRAAESALEEMDAIQRSLAFLCLSTKCDVELALYEDARFAADSARTQLADAPPGPGAAKLQRLLDVALKAMKVAKKSLCPEDACTVAENRLFAAMSVFNAALLAEATRGCTDASTCSITEADRAMAMAKKKYLSSPCFPPGPAGDCARAEARVEHIRSVLLLIDSAIEIERQYRPKGCGYDHTGKQGISAQLQQLIDDLLEPDFEFTTVVSSNASSVAAWPTGVNASAVAFNSTVVDPQSAALADLTTRFNMSLDEAEAILAAAPNLNAESFSPPGSILLHLRLYYLHKLARAVRIEQKACKRHKHPKPPKKDYYEQPLCVLEKLRLERIDAIQYGPPDRIALYPPFHPKKTHYQYDLGSGRPSCKVRLSTAFLHGSEVTLSGATEPHKLLEREVFERTWNVIRYTTSSAVWSECAQQNPAAAAESHEYTCQTVTLTIAGCACRTNKYTFSTQQHMWD